jgi:hypothetical protein
MHEIFWDQRLWEKVFTGEYIQEIRRDEPSGKTLRNGEIADRTQFVSWLNPTTNEEHVRVHQYLLASGEIAASGCPDPKRIVMGQDMYRQIEVAECAICNRRVEKPPPVP